MMEGRTNRSICSRGLMCSSLITTLGRYLPGSTWGDSVGCPIKVAGPLFRCVERMVGAVDDPPMLHRVGVIHPSPYPSSATSRRISPAWSCPRRTRRVRRPEPISACRSPRAWESARNPKL